MNHARHSPCFFGVVFLAALQLHAQTGGFLTGIVRERSGAPLPAAEVRLQNEATGARQTITTEAAGRYESGELGIGSYKVTVRSAGFRTIHQTGIAVAAGRTRVIDFISDVLPLQQEMTVESGPASVDDPNADQLTISRGSPQSRLPSNGRDLHVLYSIMPGAVSTPASVGDGGQFTVGGQRPNSNTFRIDGISGNNGLGLVALAGSSPGATLPGMTTIGSTQSLVAKEETERVELRSFDFSAEGGERPGALIAVQTRPGTNDFHGSFFGYARPKFLDSRDWFAVEAHSALTPASLEGWGGSFGGPIWPKHTFFFASVEKAKVQDTADQLLALPSFQARAEVAPGYQAFLNAFPLSGGRALTGTQSLGDLPLLKDANISNYGVRIDQNIGIRIHLFARYSDVPSSSTTAELGTANSSFAWSNATLGISTASVRTSQELRFNFSQATADSEHVRGFYSDRSGIEVIENNLAGVDFTSDPAANYFGPRFSGAVTALSLGGVGQAISGQSGKNVQHQYESTDLVAIVAGRNTLRFGGDFIALQPSRNSTVSTLAVSSPGLEALLSGQPLSISGYQSLEGGEDRVYRASAFAQDAFRINQRLSLELGLRWEVVPPVPAYELDPYTGYHTAGLWGGTGTDPSAVPINSNHFPQTPSVRWPMRYGQIAPRFGLAYRVSLLDVVLRIGAGSFYDPGLGSSVNPANFNPLNSWQYVAPPNAAPTSSSILKALPPLQTLYLPQVWEWRTSLEKSLRAGSVLSLSYLGSSAQHLLRTEATVSPDTAVLESMQFTSHAASNYQALLAQFRGNLTPNLYALFSYTWAHSIDTGSSDSGVFLTSPGYNDTVDRGSSSFDIRHAFAASVGFRFPKSASGHLRWLTAGWNLSGTVQARTGFPFDVTSIDRSVGLGFENTGRPDLVPNQPMWLKDANVPGGRLLNRGAFLPVAPGMSGTLGRNVLNGPGLTQLDTSLRRQFHLYRESGIEFNISAFNLFNQRSYSNPVSYLGSPLFGQPTSAASLMLGSGSPTGGLTPIYQAGGPRTVEVGLRFRF